jgi:uncharacterized membrane protein YraQ (UPF0718 family)
MESQAAPVAATQPPSLAATQIAPAPRSVPIWQVSLAFWILFLAVLASHALKLGNVAQLTTFGVIFASIVIEAMPFILLGALVSAAVAVFVPDRVFARIGSLPRRLQLPGATLAGFGFPVCECGSVPIGRRLIARGMHPSAGLGFMFSAPILNPIVLISTWVAFGGGTRGAEMVAGRATLGFIVAMTAGLVIAGQRTSLLRQEPEGDGCELPGDDHDHSDAEGRSGAFLEHLIGDLLFMSRFLVLGAAASALMQTFVPQNILSGVAGAAVIGILALMAFAFMLALCSEADAFVATSFTAFPLSAQLGFLVFGPILDAKLAAIYGATFRPPFIRRLVIVAVPLILAGSLLFGALVT